MGRRWRGVRRIAGRRVRRMQRGIWFLFFDRQHRSQEPVAAASERFDETGILRRVAQSLTQFIDGGTDFIEHISGVTAGVVIGDRALLQRNVSKYTYDLALAWKQMTGLPFVFAAWVANKKLDPDFIDAFNRANAYGVNHIDEVLATVSFPWYDLKKYYTQNISYTLTDDKQKGLNLFLEYLSI